MGIIQRQGLKHTIVSYIGVGIGMLSAIFIYPREEELYGLFQLIYTSGVICMSFFMLGFNIHAVRFFPNFQNKKNEHNGFLGFLLTGGMVGFFLFLLLLPFVKFLLLDFLFKENDSKDVFTQFFYYLIPIVFLFIFNFLLSKYISNFHRIVVPNILNEFLLKITLPSLTLLYMADILTMKIFVQAIVIHYFIVFIGLILYTKSLGQFSLKTNFKFIKKPLAKEIKEYSIFGMLSALGTRIATTIDVLMVAALISIESGGGFAIIRVISEVIAKPNQAINAIAAPIISKSWNINDMDEIKMIYQKSSTTLLILGVYIFLGVWCSIDDLFSIMPNSTATQTGKYVFLFLGLAKIVDLATSVNSPIIGYSKKFRFNFYSLMILAVLNIVFNLLFIPKYQIVGAALATFCSIFLFNLAKLIFIWVQFKMQPFTFATLKISLLAGFCWAVIYFISLDFHPFVNIMLRSILLTILYGGAVLYFKISPDVNGMVKDGLDKLKGFVGK